MLKNKISIIKIIINIYIFNFILNNMKILFLKSILKVIENMITIIEFKIKWTKLL